MPDTQIECQGLPCPQPVLKCKEIVDNKRPAALSVVVDNEAAKINVSRFLTTQGYEVNASEQNNEFILSAVSSGDTCEVCKEMSETEIADITTHKNLVFIGADVLGQGDDELGHKLMFNFVATLKEMGSDLWRIIMVNSAVKLAVAGHPCVEPLQQLEEKGVSILVCGTCLEHFGLTADQQVGEVTNMLDVVTSLQLATKTIRV